jgi:ABC-2 type transport system permease protein
VSVAWLGGRAWPVVADLDVQGGAGTGRSIDPTEVSLTGIQVGQAVVAVLAVLVISGEYSTGMIHTTFTAMPRRSMVLAAKTAVLTGLVLPAAVVAVAGSLAAGG